MMTLENVIALIVTLLAVMVVIGVFRFLFGTSTKKWKMHRAETVDKWKEAGVEFEQGPSGGRFCGLESMGDKYGERDFGIVAITTEDLRVTRMSETNDVWCIPFDEMVSVAFESEFLGNRAKKTPFIVIEFEQNGKIDNLGFQVADYDEWAEKLRDLADVPLYELEEEED